MSLGSEALDDFERLAELERYVRSLLDRISALEQTVEGQAAEILALQP